MVGLVEGLLTGLPPFITAGSVVLLLGGTVALGTVSPTSCNDGSLYMATVGWEEKKRNRRREGGAEEGEGEKGKRWRGNERSETRKMKAEGEEEGIAESAGDEDGWARLMERERKEEARRGEGRQGECTNRDREKMTLLV